MMKKNNSKVKDSYLKKIETFKKYNKAYYDSNSPIVDDNVYDSLKIDILDLEKKYKFLKNKYSPSINVGYKPSKNFKNKT